MTHYQLLQEINVNIKDAQDLYRAYRGPLSGLALLLYVMGK